MGLFDGINISASGLTAERARMDIIAENLANANSTRGVDGQPYRRKGVVLQAQQTFASTLDASMRDDTVRPSGVKVAGITEDPTPGRRAYDPSHPDADADGYVTMPNVNTVQEMTDMISASRSYEANATALQTAKQMFSKALEVLR